MGDNVDIANAVVVLEIEYYLKLYQAWPPGATNADWETIARRAWFQLFAMSSEWRERPPQPPNLARELAATSSELHAAVHVVASAAVTVSRQPERLADEAKRLRLNYDRFLATPEGQERKVYLDAHPTPLARASRARGRADPRRRPGPLCRSCFGNGGGVKIRHVVLKAGRAISSSWPPDWGGSYGPGDSLAMGEQGVLKAVDREGNDLVLTITFDGRDHSGLLRWTAPPTVEALHMVLEARIGQPIGAIGDLDV